ncbi:hypothetical protein Pla163_03390 [Planctomycetes bacterium Pla163]|uniref:Uncharacterized protein n=1 Tax=Rohdeia mirabilis TaxID=2528008 RepID=A0A518CVJ4_9BACT|nr:hypothetical protein Pla163_03390 [Planctomycetes bacterium Pla163]
MTHGVRGCAPENRPEPNARSLQTEPRRLHVPNRRVGPA